MIRNQELPDGGTGSRQKMLWIFYSIPEN